MCHGESKMMRTLKNPFFQFWVSGIVFMLIFGTKLQGWLDVPLIVSFLLFVVSLYSGNHYLPRDVLQILTLFGGLTIYSGIISAIWGVQEIFFFVKFLRAMLMVLFLYGAWTILRTKLSYENFTRTFTQVVVIHSLIVILAILFPPFREAIYDFTGYTPRGPEWSRSPGLTLGFNATAIVHVLGFWFTLTRSRWHNVERMIYAIVILGSFAFLGRFIFLVGMSLVFFLFFLEKPMRSMAFAIFVAISIASSTIWLQTVSLTGDTMEGQIAANLHHFTRFFNQNDPSEISLTSYWYALYERHLYFSDKWYVLLFGNSLAGHMGFIDLVGETDSDLGVINSINANGLFVTVVLYLFYVVLIYRTRQFDWKPVALVSGMSMALTFKETGFLDSHATPLLLLLYFYQTARSNQRECAAQ